MINTIRHKLADLLQAATPSGYRLTTAAAARCLSVPL